LRRLLVSTESGVYRHHGPELAVAGRWKFRVDALITDFEKAVFEADLDVK
jgi:hypothetical protein